MKIEDMERSLYRRYKWDRWERERERKLKSEDKQNKYRIHTREGERERKGRESIQEKRKDFQECCKQNY